MEFVWGTISPILPLHVVLALSILHAKMAISRSQPADHAAIQYKKKSSKTPMLVSKTLQAQL
jgi:hypothetical protein